jgi:hypothetical protein
MIPDKVLIWCHSFWRNDFFQPLLGLLPGVILFGSMRLQNSYPIPSFATHALCDNFTHAPSHIAPPSTDSLDLPRPAA